jgi:hypothetical protein
MTLPLLALMEDAPVAGVCLHRRDEMTWTALAAHHLGADGRCCNHDIVCDCGALVGTESWRLDIGAKAHAKAYPEVAA